MMTYRQSVSHDFFQPCFLVAVSLLVLRPAVPGILLVARPIGHTDVNMLPRVFAVVAPRPAGVNPRPSDRKPAAQPVAPLWHRYSTYLCMFTCMGYRVKRTAEGLLSSLVSRVRPQVTCLWSFVTEPVACLPAAK